jgi:5'-nucleotidase (lipoprotein e(P4) family)
MKSRSLIFFFALPGLGWSQPAPAAEPHVHQKLMPTLWVQTAPEWRALCEQAYRTARVALNAALHNKKFTAATEQMGPAAGKFWKKKPAVILDVDETVLDNSPGQARQVNSNTDFVAKDWAQWVSEAKAEAIPGAVEFCKYARSRGVRVFFVTNRDATDEAATRKNLERLGFPLDTDIDTLLLRGEKPEWSTSEKGARRQAVAAGFRIVMLVGDDFGDFLSGVRVSPEKRRELAAPHGAKWGREWIVLPNPGYGTWEEALYDVPKSADPEERMRQKRRYLNPAIK